MAVKMLSVIFKVKIIISCSDQMHTKKYSIYNIVKPAYLQLNSIAVDK